MPDCHLFLSFAKALKYEFKTVSLPKFFESIFHAEH